jgi:hypothetical protein
MVKYEEEKKMRKKKEEEVRDMDINEERGMRR